MGSDGPTVRRILTRDGLIALTPPWESLGATKAERTEVMIGKYAEGLRPGLRGPMRDVYLRAYRRAELLEGNPDEFLDSLPSESELLSNASEVAGSTGDTGEVSEISQQPAEGHEGTCEEW